MDVLAYLAIVVIAYLLGSISTGMLVSKAMGRPDLHKVGSGNTGATNALRTMGKKGGAIVFAGDVVKALLACLVGRLWMGQNGALLAGLFVILGHNWPVFFGFKGGKGVATLVGAVLGIHPITVLLCFGIWFIVLMITHYVSLSSMIAGCCFPIFVLLSPKINHSVPLVVFSFVIAALLIWTHRKNIDRLKKGTESKIYIWRPVASRRRNDPDK